MTKCGAAGVGGDQGSPRCATLMDYRRGVATVNGVSRHPLLPWPDTLTLDSGGLIRPGSHHAATGVCKETI